MFDYSRTSTDYSTALIVETVCSITRQYSATFFVALVALGVQFAFSVWWAAGVLGLSTEGGTAGNLVFFLVFSYYWTSQVISNVVHVTISGLVGSWYFLNGTPSMPRNPVGGAARRALTTSFGPICFASLFVAAIQTTRFVLRQIARGHELLKAIVDCILGRFWWDDGQGCMNWSMLTYLH